MRHDPWPSFRMRHAAIAVVLAAIALSCFRVSDVHYSSTTQRLSNRLAAAINELTHIEQRLDEHTCKAGICCGGCGTTIDGRIAPMGGCQWRPDTEAALASVREQVRDLEAALARAAWDQRIYRTRGLAVALPMMVLVALALPIGWFVSHLGG